MHAHVNRRAERMRADPACRADALAERDRTQSIMTSA